LLNSTKGCDRLLFQVIKYCLVGLLVWCVGALFSGSSTGFQKRSEPVQLLVIDLETQRNSDGQTTYRPIFLRSRINRR